MSKSGQPGLSRGSPTSICGGFQHWPLQTSMIYSGATRAGVRTDADCCCYACVRARRFTMPHHVAARRQIAVEV